MCNELSLCQTSTIMLGREALKSLPFSRSWSADDRIVLAISKKYAILHSDEVVAIYHSHDGVSRMANNPRKKFLGVFRLVFDHQEEILRVHGLRRVILWYLRILNAFLIYQSNVARRFVEPEKPGFLYLCMRFIARVYSKIIFFGHTWLDKYLRKHFLLMYF